MTKHNDNEGDKMLIAQGEARPLLRRDDESDAAYAARLAFCKLPPGERSVTAAFRAVKGEPTDSKARAPGRYFAWSKRFDWAGSAIDWDSYLVALPAQADVEDAAVVHQTETVQATELQELIALKMTELRTAPVKPAGLLGWLIRLLPGRREKKQAELDAINAAALESLTAAYSNLQTAQNRRTALGTAQPQLPSPPGGAEPE